MGEPQRRHPARQITHHKHTLPHGTLQGACAARSSIDKVALHALRQLSLAGGAELLKIPAPPLI
jgi:hypothetical protein